MLKDVSILLHNSLETVVDGSLIVRNASQRVKISKQQNQHTDAGTVDAFAEQSKAAHA